MIGAYFARLTRRERRELEACHTCGAIILPSLWGEHVKLHDPCTCGGRGRPCYSCATAGDTPPPPPAPPRGHQSKRGRRCTDRHDEHPNFTYAANHWHPEPTDSTKEADRG